jgi:hypothetical protein
MHEDDIYHLKKEQTELLHIQSLVFDFCKIWNRINVLKMTG